MSGTPLDVLENTKHYSRVRTPDGAEGWVKSAYLVTEKPPRLVLTRLQQEKDALDKHLQTSLQELEAAKQDGAQLAVKLQAANAELADHDLALTTLQTDNERYRARLEDHQPRVPLYWALGGSLVALLLGAAVTQRVIDYRIRRRHGGFRVY